MKLNSIAAGALLTVASFAASATTTATILAPGYVNTPTFSDVTIGSITVGGLSDITGLVFAADSLSYVVPATPFSPSYTLSLALDKVTFSSATVGSLTDLDSSAAGYSFHDVAAGTYLIKASGTIDPTAYSAVKGVAFLGSTYSVTAVPEPETYGMLLGGLALVGAIARRKANKAA